MFNQAPTVSQGIATNLNQPRKNAPKSYVVNLFKQERTKRTSEMELALIHYRRNM